MSVPVVGVVMGSESDLPTMQGALDALDEFAVPYEVDVVSAHRTPAKMMRFGLAAEERGFQVLIAGAGGAAHLPGMLASLTTLPVIGVPVSNGPLQGIDALLSIVQMPKGVPVATVAVGNSRNAGLLAVQMLAIARPDLREDLHTFRKAQQDRVAQMSARVRSSQ